MSGFYLMHRGWMDNPVFGRDTFSRRTAWVWLIEEAAWQQRQIGYGPKAIELRRGQLSHSYRHMAKAWGWSLGAVQRYFDRLLCEKMVSVSVIHGNTVVSIENYDKYQVGARIANTLTDTLPIQQRYTSDTNKKEGNNLDSELANASSSGADAPPITPPIDLKAQIFGPIRAWLVASSGRSESSVRSWLGRCCAEFNDGNVIAAAAQLMAAPATNDPFSSLKKELQRMAGHHGKSSKPSAADKTRDIRSGLANALMAQGLDGGDPERPGDDRADFSGPYRGGEVIDAMRSEAGGYDAGDDARVVRFAR